MAEYLCEEDMNTGEYISRDVALRQLNATCLATDCNNYKGVMCRACAYADAMDIIEAIPAADVQPVKHGHWIEEVREVGGFFKLYQTYIHCSECGKEHYSGTLPKPNFCDNCGADMRGDSE